jgi:hypothetical protein
VNWPPTSVPPDAESLAGPDAGALAGPEAEAVAGQVFVALADPTRRAILAALAAGGPATAPTHPTWRRHD